MSELINRIKCPMGCSNSLFTESTKVITENSDPLLLESGKQSKAIIKTYTCHCCGNTFEMKQQNQGDKFVL